MSRSFVVYINRVLLIWFSSHVNLISLIGRHYWRSCNPQKLRRHENGISSWKRHGTNFQEAEAEEIDIKCQTSVGEKVAQLDKAIYNIARL